MNNFEEVFKKEQLDQLKNNLSAMKIILEDKLKKEEQQLLELYDSLPEMLHQERLFKKAKEE